MSQSKGGPPSAPPNSLCVMASAMLRRPASRSLCTCEQPAAHTRNKFMSGLLRLYSRDLDDLRPFLDLGPDMGREFLRRSRHDGHALALAALADRRHGHDRDDLLVEARDDLARRSRRNEQPRPVG